MGRTLTFTRTFILATLFLTLGLCTTPANGQIITNVTWTGNAFSASPPKAGGGTTAWWGIGVRAGNPSTTENNYWNNWNSGWGGAPSPYAGSAFVHGLAVSFGSAGTTNQFITTSVLGDAPQATNVRTVYDTLTTRTDNKTRVSTMQVTGTSWNFSGAGVFGESLLLNEKGSIWLANTRFSFAQGVLMESGTMTFTGDNVWDYYKWYEDMDKSTSLENTIKITGAATLMREQNNIFEYKIGNRFHISSGASARILIPEDRQIDITKIDSFNSYISGNGQYVRGGAFYLEAENTGDGTAAANISRGNTGTGSKWGAMYVTGNAAYRGSGFYSEQDLLMQGNTHFKDNIARDYGAAIYMAGTRNTNTLQLNTDRGDIAFTNNMAFGDLDGAGFNIGTPNEFYLKSYANVILNGAKAYGGDGKFYKTNAAGDFVKSDNTVTTTPDTDGVLFAAIRDTFDYGDTKVYKTNAAGQFLKNGGGTTFTPDVDGIEVTADENNPLWRNSIFLEKNITMNVNGSNRVFINDGIRTNTNGGGGGGNTLTINLTGSNQSNFIQFGGDSNSLLNTTEKAGGTVLVQSGEFRILQGGLFQTFGQGTSTFSVNSAGTLAGGGTAGWSSINADGTLAGGSGTIGAEAGFFINGKIAPDSFVYTTPTTLDGTHIYPANVGSNIGQLNLKGNVTLGNAGMATMMVDLSSTDVLNKNGGATYGFANADNKVFNSDMILVDSIEGTTSSGNLYLTDGAGKTAINISSWTVTSASDGKYVLAASKKGFFASAGSSQAGVVINNDNIRDYFYDIIPQGVDGTQNKRRSATLSIERGLLDTTKPVADQEYDLVLQTTNDGNVELIWTGLYSPNDWKDENVLLDTTTQWIRRLEANGKTLDIPLNFRNGDYVIFNKADNFHSLFNVNITSPYDVAGMRVEAGNYTFTGGFPPGQALNGNADPSYKGVNATGRLDIISADANDPVRVDLSLATNFEKGARLGNNATVVLNDNRSLGVYVPTTTTPSNERGTIYLNNSNATIVTNPRENGLRTVINHYELVGNSELAFNIPTNGTFTITGVDTSQSLLADGSKHRGGAMFIDTDASFTKTAGQKMVFDGNSAVDGGAIYAMKGLSIGGNTLFQGNTATGLGGAIFMDGDAVSSTVTMNATGGDIVFTNNNDLNGRNSIHLNQRRTLVISGNDNVFFDDPISAALGASAAGNQLIKNDNGIVQFQGINSLSANGSASRTGGVDVNAGTFRLANGATFTTGSYEDTAYFKLAGGATLAGDGQINVNYNAFARTNAFEIRGTVSPDSAIFTSSLTGTEKLTVADSEKIGTLTLNGGNALIDGATFNFDIGNGNGSGGISDKIYIVGDVNKGAESIVNIGTVRNANISGDYLLISSDAFTGVTSKDITGWFQQLSSDNIRESGELMFVSSGNNGVYDQLWLTGFNGANNLTVYWTGATGTMNWDEQGLDNWINGRNADDTVTKFYDKDQVVFDNTIAANVTEGEISLVTDVFVAGMDVVSGDYKIVGTNKTISGDKTTLAASTGQLRVNGADAKLTLGVATDFVEGTVLGGNGTIVIAKTDALGVYNHENYIGLTPATASKAGYVNVATGTISVEPSARLTVANRFNVTGTLTFDAPTGGELKVFGVDVTANSPATTGQNDGAAIVAQNNANVVKKGAGNLVFEGNVAENGGAVHAAGNFNLTVNEGLVEFKDNVALNNGGAINGTGNVNIKGDVRFAGQNEAHGNGGAVYMAPGKTLALDATNGADGTKTATIAFVDPSVAANDVYLDGANLVTNGTGDVFFGTAVTGVDNGTNKSNMTVNMGTTGRTVMKAASSISGNLTVTAGDLAINAATFNVAGNSTIAQSGILSGNGTLRSPNTITVNGTLSPDSYTYNYTAATHKVSRTGSAIGDLTLDGAATFDGATLLIDVQAPNDSDKVVVTGIITAPNKNNTVKLTSSAQGTYDVLTGANASLNDVMDTFALDLTMSGGRMSATKQLKNGDPSTMQIVVVTGGNAKLFWTGTNNGTATNATWSAANSSATNWITNESDPPGSRVDFINGDYVVFNDESYVNRNAKTVTLSGSGFNVAGMEVLGGNYIFTGESIASNIAGYSTDYTLKIDGSSTKATFETVSVDFQKDLLVSNGAEAIFKKGATFGQNANIQSGSKATFNDVLTVTGNLNVTEAEATLNAVNSIGTTNLGGTTNGAKVTLGNDKGFGASTVNVAAGNKATITSVDDRAIANNISNLGNLTVTMDTGKTFTYNGIMTGATGNFTKSGAGTMVFAANGSTVGGNLSVTSGTMKVNNGITLTVGGTSTINGGGILAGAGTVDGTTFNFTGGGIRAGDTVGDYGTLTLDGSNATWNSTTLYVDLDADSNATNLIHVVNGSVNVSGSNMIDLSSWGKDNTEYTIAIADNTFIKTGDIANYFTIKLNGQTLNDRRQASVKLEQTDHNLVLGFGEMANIALVWTGPGSGQWDSNDKNWTIDGTTTTENFVDGDYVIFRNGAGGSPVNVNNDVKVAGMDIDGGTYVFNGSEISSDPNSKYVGKTEKLTIGGNANVTINNATNFANGTEFVGDATVTVGNNRAFGTNGAGNQGLVAVDSNVNATIKSDGTKNYTLDNRFNVANDGNLTLISSGSKDLNIGQVVTLGNNSGLTVDGTGNTIFRDAVNGTHADLVKNGTGTMILQNGWNDATGSATINAGELQIASGKTLNIGSFDLKQGATLSGDNATVKTNGSNIIIAGTVSPGENDGDISNLVLDGNTTIKTGAVLSYDLGGSGSNDQINVIGSVDFENDYVISINSWKKGEYDILTSTVQMDPDEWKNYILERADGKPLNDGRRSTTVGIKDDNHTLYLSATGENANITWNGTSGNMTWNQDNTGNMNWTNDSTKKPEYFMDDDSVTFTQKGAGEVTIDNPVTVSDMTVNGGKYTFTGGGINGDASDTSLIGKEGKLKLNGGSDTTFDTWVDFDGGIEISGSGTKVSTTTNGQLITDGILNVGAGTTLDIDPITGSIIADELVLNGTITAKKTNQDVANVLQVEKALTEDQMKKLSSSLDYSFGLVEREALFHDGNKFMDLVYETLTVSEFADKNDLEHNETEASKGLDDAFANGDFGELSDYLYSLETADEVRNVIDQMRGSELYADAQMLSMWRPWRKVFGQLYDSCCVPCFDDCPEENRGGTTLGQPQQLRGYSVWVDVYHQYVDLHSDLNARDARTNRTGTLVGLDAPIGYFSKLGVVLGGSNPYVKNKFGKIESEEFTVGLYSKSHFGDSSYLLGFLGYSRDDFEAKRYCLGETYESDANGDALYLSFEYVRPVCRQNLVLFPMIALDYQQSWVGDFKETGGQYAQRTSNKSFGQMHARFGLDSKIYTSSRTNINTRLQYGYLMAGHTVAQTNTTFVNSPKSGPMNLRSSKIGRSYLNMGVGGDVYLGSAKRVKLFGDYDFEYTGNYRGHTGQFGVMVNW